MQVDEVQRRARRGTAILLMRRAFAVLFGLAATVIIARLAPPRAFGLAAMSAVILSLAEMFRDFGLTSAVLRKGDIDPEEINFLFWFNAAATLVLAVGIAAIAPLAAMLYGEPIVLWVILWSLVGFVMSGLSLQHRALLARELRFGALAAIDTTAMVAGALTTIVVAWVRHDVWAIVAGTGVQSATSAVLNTIFSGWRPGRPARIKGLRELAHFGANASLFSMSVFMARNAGPVLIGYASGAAALGQFNRAMALFQLPTTNLVEPIVQAMLPVLTRLRNHEEVYRQTYLDLVRNLSMVLMPGGVILAAAAMPLTVAALGETWRTAGVVLAILALPLPIFGLSHAASHLLITQDRSKDLRTIGLVEMVVRVGAVAIGVSFGLIPAAWAITLSSIFAVALRVYIGGGSGLVLAKDQLKAVIPSLPVGLAAGIGCALGWLATWALAAPDWLATLLIIGIGGPFATAAIWFVPMSRRALFGLLEQFHVTAVLNKLKRFTRG